MARQRRRVRFKPFRMGEKTRNTILVGLCVLLAASIGGGFEGACRRGDSGGRESGEVYATFDGRAIRYGPIQEVRRLCSLIYRTEKPLTEEEAVLWLTQYYEAQRAGIRVSDAEVVDAIRNERFPRRVRVEYVVADNAAFGKDATVSDKEIEDAYQRERDKRFKKADGAVQPLSEVREEIETELRGAKGGPLAKAALEGLRAAAVKLTGGALENALKQLAAERKPLRFGETNAFTPRQAQGALYAIVDAPGIVERVFRDRVGQVSEPLALRDGWCVFRVVSRSRGFGPQGRFHPEEEGWVRQGYGTINVKSYGEVLGEMGVTGADMEMIERQRLALLTLPRLVGSAMADLPRTTVEARYRRDNTQAVAAYITVRAADFALGITPTADELRDFYARHKDLPRTATRPGYRQPERVAIEYVLGRKDRIAEKLSEVDLQRYYERHRAFFGPAFAAAREDVRKRLAEETLTTIIGKINLRAADRAAAKQAPDFAALVAEEAKEFPAALAVETTAEPFSAEEADSKVPDLSGAKLGELLFGERGQLYAVAGAEPKQDAPAHAISEVFPCNKGRFFFRVLSRQPSRDLPYDNLPDHLAKQLTDDVKNDKAFDKAKKTAADYREKVSLAALQRLAERLGTKLLETEFLKPTDPFPGLNKPLPDLYAQLAGGKVGDLSDVVEVGDRFLAARLAATEEVKGNKFQLVACAAQGLSPTYDPSLYEQRAAYAAAPHSFLDPPTPIPFEKVKDDIAKLLARRQALKLATERAEKALAAMHETPRPDLAAVATKHGLKLQANVAVDLAKPEATADIGRAAGFRDAVTALKPGEVSRIVASADARFLFVLKSRDDKTATIDLAAAHYESAKVDDKEVRQYYDDHRDRAYVTGDEIKDAPSWDAAPAAAQGRVQAKLKEDWAKKPFPERLTVLRDSLVFEAFRTVPSAVPLPAVREIEVGTATVGPFPPARPEAFLADEPAVLAAVRALKPGEVTKPIGLTKGEGALIALLADRRPGGLARARVAIFHAADFLKAVPEPDAAAIESHFKANRAAFRLPAQVTLEYVFADLASRRRPVSDAECIRHYELHADDLYRGHSYEESEHGIRADLSNEAAKREARAAADRAFEGATRAKGAEGDLAALAKRFNLAYGRTQPFAVEEPAIPATLGRIVDIAGVLGDTKQGDLVPRVVASSAGYAVCRVVARTAARDAELIEVRDKVAQALRLQGARDAARKAAEAFRTAAAAAPFDKAVAQAAVAPKAVETELLDARYFLLPGEGAVPAIADAIFALDKPGLTPAVVQPESGTAFVAEVIERKPEELVTLETAAVGAREPFWASERPTTDDLKAHYEANKESFRRPDVANVECLALPYADLSKALPALSDAELRKEYDRSVAARELYYRDWAATVQPAYLGFDAAKERVREHLSRIRGRAEAAKLLGEALKQLKAEGAKADLAAYAAKHPPLAVTQPEWLDRKRNELAKIGHAPDLARAVFAAKKGDLAGPVLGMDGACLLRVLDLTLTHIPPFDDIKMEVEAGWQQARAIERMVHAAGKVHEALVAATAKAADKDKADAFRKAAESAPRVAEVPYRIPVALSMAFRPLDGSDPERAQRQLIRAELVPAIFRLREGHMAPVVEDSDRTECYVALATQFIAPKEPTEGDLFGTEYRLSDITRRMASFSWQRYLENLTERE